MVSKPGIQPPGPRPSIPALILSGVPLDSLPASLLLLGGLKVLHLGGNRLCDIPAETGAFIDALPEKDDWKGSQTGC